MIAPYFLGVDGGTTKTIALLADRTGAIHGSGRAANSNIYDVPLDTALANLTQAIQQALAAAGVQADQLEAGAFSLCGADYPEDFSLFESALREQGFGRSVLVVNDAIGALRAGSPDGTGVVVVCGTGIATGARSPDGRIWHSSFWQEAGGAEDLGRQALRAVLRAELGIDPPTSLTPRILAQFALPTVEAVLHRLTHRNHPPAAAQIRTLARVVLDEAQAGDPAARQIVTDHGRLLGDYALAAARQVGIASTPFNLILAGGVLRHPTPLLADTLITRVREQSPDARPLTSRFEPAVGAVLLALESASIPIDDTVIAAITATAPGATLFAT